MPADTTNPDTAPNGAGTPGRLHSQSDGAGLPSDALRSPGNETVLIVDDAPLERTFLVDFIRHLDYRVLEARGAVEAKGLAEAGGQIHLLFLNLTLAETPELELARWFHAAYPGIKTLVATGSLWELSYPTGQVNPINFLVKPFTPLELAQMVRRVLG